MDGSLGDQIELSFFKDVAGDPTISAGFRYVQGGVAQGTVQRLGESDAYNGETFTRPGFFAIETVVQTVGLPSGLALTLAALAAAAAFTGRRSARHT